MANLPDFCPIIKPVQIMNHKFNFFHRTAVGFLCHQDAYLAKRKTNATYLIKGSIKGSIKCSIIQTYNVNQMQCGQSSDQENVKKVNVNKTPCNT